MSFSLSTVLYASVWGGIFSLCLLALLNQKKAYALMRPGLLVAFLAVIVLRFLLPVEFFFTQTIPLTFFLPDLYTFLRADLLLEQSVLEWLVVFWIAGVAVIGWIKTCRYRRGARCLEQIRNRSEEETLSKDDRRNFAGQDLQIVRSPWIQSPFTAGLKEARIYLPARVYEDEDLDWILRHESAHIRHRDLWKNIGLMGLTTLFWWYVPVYVLPKVLTLLEEMGADHAVLEQCGAVEKIRYAKFLVKESEKPQQRMMKTMPVSSFSTQSGWMMGKRLSYMLHEKKNMGLDMVLIGFFSVLIFFGFFFVLEPDYSNSEQTQEMMEGTFGADDLQEAKTITVQPDGTVEFVLKDGSQLVMPSLAFARQICPDLKVE